MQHGGRRFLAMAMVCALCGAARALAESGPPLRSASSFAILGGSAVRNSGTTLVAGNVGVSPGTTVDLDRRNVTVGEIRNDLARQAQNDVAAVWEELGRGTCTELPVLSGTIGPGVYCVGAEILSGMLTLDAGENADAVWVFQMSGLVTVAGSSVVVHRGQDRNVFWRVDGSATLGERTAFIGNIIATQNITLRAGATLSGRALARAGAVTLNTNRVSMCCEPIALTPITSQRISASGGTGIYQFAVIAGSLPPGLTIATDGTITGASTVGGNYTFTVLATDTHGCSGARTYGIEIPCAGVITLSPPSLPSGNVGSEYTETITASGGSGSYEFSVDETLLPPGLNLTNVSGTGLLSGKPTTPGTYTFTVTAEDTVSHCTGSISYTVTITGIPCTIAIAPAVLSDGTVNMFYSATLDASGGSGSYVFSATGLPGWLSPLTGRILTGTPVVAGVYPFTVTVTDTITGCIASRDYTITITIVPVCTLTVTPAALPDGIVGTPYTATILPTGGSGSYTFEVTGVYPPGLTPPPDISGTPTAAGTYTFTVTARDTVTGCTASVTYTVRICPVITIPRVLPTGYTTFSYSESISPSGGTPPYTFTEVSGEWPPDLELFPDGTVAGDPTTVGVYVMRVRVTDSTCGVAEEDITITIATAPLSLGAEIDTLSDYGRALLCIFIAMAGIVAIRRVG